MYTETSMSNVGVPYDFHSSILLLETFNIKQKYLQLNLGVDTFSNNLDINYSGKLKCSTANLKQLRRSVVNKIKHKRTTFYDSL